jgi:hypothetical protein
MNERIKELAEQATFRQFFMPKSNSVSALDKFNGTFTEQEAIEKFAELLIRECADICINENVSNLDLKVMRESGKFTVQDLATKSCAENLAKRIKERFGL